MKRYENNEILFASKDGEALVDSLYQGRSNSWSSSYHPIVLAYKYLTLPQQISYHETGAILVNTNDLVSLENVRACDYLKGLRNAKKDTTLFYIVKNKRQGYDVVLNPRCCFYGDQHSLKKAKAAYDVEYNKFIDYLKLSATKEDLLNQELETNELGNRLTLEDNKLNERINQLEKEVNRLNKQVENQTAKIQDLEQTIKEKDKIIQQLYEDSQKSFDTAINNFKSADEYQKLYLDMLHKYNALTDQYNAVAGF